MPWFVYVLKYASSEVLFYAASSKRADRLKAHIRAAMNGGSDALQRDLHAMIRYQILALGQRPILHKIFVGLSTKKEAAALEKKTIEVLGTQLLKSCELVNIHCNGRKVPMAKRRMLGAWQE